MGVKCTGKAVRRLHVIYFVSESPKETRRLKDVRIDTHSDLVQTQRKAQNFLA